MIRPLSSAFAIFAALFTAQAAVADSTPAVRMLRLPHGAIQPQVAVGDDGTVHLIYFRGDAQHGDLSYTRLNEGDTSFGPTMAINQQAGSAIAMGNIRGAHLALGRRDRPHVAWMGAKEAPTKAPGGAAPMLYTRLNDAGTAFETERNVISKNTGLDGGGSLAADPQGHVYVVWHAPAAGTKGEVNRRVWVARSDDDGRTFQPERLALERPLGCCGCCGMRAVADDEGRLFVLFRSAEEKIHRDMWLLASNDRAATFAISLADRWPIDKCVMSTAALTATPERVLAAWETQGQVYFGSIDPATGRVTEPLAAPGGARGRKYPVVAENKGGDVLLAWTEGMGWERGGELVWQVYGADGRPVTGAAGRASGVPVWSVVAAFADRDGQFVIVY